MFKGNQSCGAKNQNQPHRNGKYNQRWAVRNQQWILEVNGSFNGLRRIIEIYSALRWPDSDAKKYRPPTKNVNREINRRL
jgi:hypothetical protein